MSQKTRWAGAAILILVASALVLGLVWSPRAESTAAPSPTFATDVAPIVFERCAPCHRPGEAAPFPLLSHDQVSRHGREIVEVIEAGRMPPWLPDPEVSDFVGERVLSAREIATIKRWVEQGMAPGDPESVPAPPVFTPGWQLGEPDLIVRLERPFELAERGRDVYRAFLVPVPVDEPRFVRAFEFRPGNSRVVHHAVIQIDRTSPSLRIGSHELEEMRTPASENPDGQFLGWSVGRTPSPGTPGMAWRLTPGTDLVVQLHMVPAGKPESVRPEIGLYFTDEPPTRLSFTLVLRSADIDIPPGESEHEIEERFTLPVDVELLAIYPHAHYLGREMKGFALLPGGAREWLIHIRDWDFAWQDQYFYREPVQLPAGSTVVMQYTYNNSKDNPRAPSAVPKRVRYGSRSSDEMGELTLQLAPRSPEELSTLARAAAAYDEQVAQRSPRTLLDRANEHYERQELEQALELIERAQALDPDHPYVHFSLGAVAARKGEEENAERHYRRALELDPEVASAHEGLARLRFEQGRYPESVAHWERVLEFRADDAEAHYQLALALIRLGGDASAEAAQRAERHMNESARLRPELAPAQFNLGVFAVRRGDLARARTHFIRALELDPQYAAARQALDRLGHPTQ